MNKMSNKLKYDEFYCTIEGKVLPLNTLDKDNYLLYENKMLCPDCRKADLSYVRNTKTPHLKQKPKALHHNHCPYQYVGASRQSIEKHFDTLTDEQIGYKLDSIIRYLCTDKNTRQAYLTDEPTQHNPMLIESVEKKTRAYTSLKRKSLGVYFTDEDIGKYYVFYGKAKLGLDIINKDNKIYAFIKIFIGKKVISIYRPKSLIPNDIDKEKEYNIVCIGHLESLSKIKLLKPNCLKYQKV